MQVFTDVAFERLLEAESNVGGIASRDGRRWQAGRVVMAVGSTVDGDFWIAADPAHLGLVVAAGDNGHGFKFAPLLGEWIADAVENKPNPKLTIFRWRPDVTYPTSRVTE